MTSDVRNWRWRCFGLCVALLLLATTVPAAEKHKRPAKTGKYNPEARTVEMFAAIEKGDIAVRLIPKDSTQCRVLIKNKTDKPLSVKLPEAFAGVPVLAQIGGGGVNANRNRSGNRGGSQGFGGGMGGRGMFYVPPEKVGQLKVAAVCLEHGKNEPRATVPYEIKPLESFTTKPGVRELCWMLGSGRMNQRAAQAAAWYLNNSLSWRELAAKRLRHANGTSEPYFSQAEILVGMRIAATAVKMAEKRKPAYGSWASGPLP